MRFLLYFVLFDRVFQRLPLLGTLAALFLYALLGLALFSLVGCGNVTRPLPYTDTNDPVTSLPSMPGNNMTKPPVSANSRIKAGL